MLHARPATRVHIRALTTTVMARAFVQQSVTSTVSGHPRTRPHPGPGSPPARCPVRGQWEARQRPAPPEKDHCGSCLVGRAFRRLPPDNTKTFSFRWRRWRRGFCTVPSASDAPPKTLTFGGASVAPGFSVAPSELYSRQRTPFALGCATGGGGRRHRKRPRPGTGGRQLSWSLPAGSLALSRVRRRVRESRSSALRAGSSAPGGQMPVGGRRAGQGAALSALGGPVSLPWAAARHARDEFAEGAFEPGRSRRPQPTGCQRARNGRPAHAALPGPGEARRDRATVRPGPEAGRRPGRPRRADAAPHARRRAKDAPTHPPPGREDDDRSPTSDPVSPGKTRPRHARRRSTGRSPMGDADRRRLRRQPGFCVAQTLLD